ncbi:MAG: nuclear transport factor 2 family protein [Acidobacteriota bacterium]|nr:nuclear transport factor 2 family protein [Acidobacteriota bacterium]
MMVNMVSEQFLMQIYRAFNKREIETVLSFVQPDVKWANGIEGGFVYGRDAVREYWRKQFEVVQPQLEPLKFERDENKRHVVTVRQIVRDMSGNLVLDQTVRQIFTIENGLISVFEIGDSEPLSKA